MKYLLLIVLLLVSGCTPPQSTKTKMDLMSIAIQYHQFVNELKSTPDSVESLANFSDPYSSLPGNKANSDAMKNALASGDYVVYWNYDVAADLPRNASVILAYHKDVPTQGGLVAFADASVHSLTKQEFENFTKASEFSSE